MDLHDFYYDLPEELIAQDPLSDRSSSRLMVLDKNTGAIEHKIFRDITEYLKPGDCLVINDTKVIPARLIGEKEGTGAAIEVLLLKRLEDIQDTWEVLVKPGKKCKVGARIVFGGGKLTGEIIDIVEEGNRLIQFSYDGIFEEILDELGQMPLPPYITHKLEDKNRYQTVYAKHEGSAAAPTAGLHFTKELLKQIEDMGVKIARVTLHVGLGTFRPVKVENILDHHMHSEFYQVDKEAADIINNTKANGGRVIAVGTTSTRTLESVADENGHIPVKSGWTEIFIYPGFEFKGIDALLNATKIYETEMKAINKKVETLIIGSGALDDKLRKQAEELGLENTYFLGRKNHTEIRQLQNLADVSLIPSRNEPFGLVVIEGTACGHPVIATNAGGIPGILNRENKDISDKTKSYVTPLGILVPPLPERPVLLDEAQKDQLDEYMTQYVNSENKQEVVSKMKNELGMSEEVINNYIDNYMKTVRGISDSVEAIALGKTKFDNEKIAEITKTNYSQDVIRDKILGIFNDAIDEKKKCMKNKFE